MTDKAATAPEPVPVTYGVCRQQDGAQIVSGVDLGTAKGERARLNAEARVITGTTVDGHPQYHGMYLGDLVRYEVRSSEGLVIA